MAGLTSHRHAGPAVALAVLTAIWGYNWVVIKLALADAPPLTFSALRAAGSSLALFLVVILLRQPLKPARGGSLLLLALFQTVGFVGFVALALETGQAGKSAVLAYTMPFWTLLMAGPLLGERIRGPQWLAVALAAAGLVGILSPWSGTLDVTASLYALAAAFCWGASNIVAKRMALTGDEVLNVSAWQMALGGAVLCLLALAFDTEPVNFSPAFSLALAYNIVLATGLAWLLWLYVLNRLSAGATGLASLGAPVFSLVTAWVQLGEVPTRSEAAGMASILAALAWLSLVGWRRFSRSTIGS